MLLQDLRHGLRLLAGSPGFTFTAVAALAIGIGANTAIFSVVNTLLLQPLPYRDADRLAILWEHNLPRDRQSNVVGPANFLQWRDLNQSFEQIAAVSLTYAVTLTGAAQPEEMQAQSISAELFDILGTPPAMGRVFAADENQPGSRVAIISDRLWKGRFGADPDVLGKPVVAQGIAYSVIGVMPQGFSFLDRSVDVWLPIGFTAQSRLPRGRSLQVVGRLKPGVTIGAAQQDMTRVGGDLTRMFPAFNTGWTVRVVSLRDELTGAVRPALLILGGAVAFVLLIACANVANLLLARATARRRELAVRAALGAGRGRLVRQLLAESAVLSIAGGAAGLLLGWWTIGALRTVAADRLSIHRLELVAVDPTVLAFTAAASLLCGLLFGIIPALTGSTTSQLGESLKAGGRTGSDSRGNRARNLFVVAEVALAVVLLVGAGLLLRSFARVLDQDRGFDASRTLTMRVALPGVRYGGPGQSTQFFDRLLQDVEQQPGVRAAGAISFLPLVGLGAATSFRVVGLPEPAPGMSPVTDVRVVSHDYFEAMGVPLLRGRLFDSRDAFAASNRVVINDAMARTYWPGEDPIGKRIRVYWFDERDDEVVGVVADVKHAGLDVEARPATFMPHARSPYGTMSLTVRADGDPAGVAAAVTAIVRRLDPELAVASVRTMDDVVDRSVAERRLTMLLLAVFAGTALLLAAVGIYGVIAYGVSQRTQEIGIRLALGAQRTDIVRLVVGQVLWLTAAGLVAGGVGAMLLTRLMAGLLFQVSRYDPVTFVAVAAVLAGVALAAGYLPSCRAVAVDPVGALRQ